MINALFNDIEKYNTIIIHRHSRPDLDALGSQLGLKYVLQDLYPNKNIYAVGDISSRFKWTDSMDEIEDEKYSGSLVIICDVAVENMVSDLRYKLADKVYVIDHHKNDCDITQNHIKDSTKVAAAELITDILVSRNIKINPKAATYLFGGIITDSGRFMYGNIESSLIAASKLISFGANAKFIYDNIYSESLASKQMKSYFTNKFEVKNGVAFLKNDKDVFDKFKVDFSDISRGMVSVMSGIDEVSIWLNFTYDIENNKIVGEFRSRTYPIVEIAKKYGGGGHDLACGCSLESWEMVDKVIEEFVSYLKQMNS